jgi:hypothetical protein
MNKLTLAAAITTAVFFSGIASADHHGAAPIAYGTAINLKVSDPAAIAGAISKIRNSKEMKESPSGVTLNQIVAGGQDDATHTILVSYPTAAAIDAQAMISANSKIVASMRSEFRDNADRVSAILYTIDRVSSPDGAVTSDNPVSWGFQLKVTDVGAFTVAFDKVWETSVKTFPGNVAFGRALINGPHDSTHFVSFQANNMETLITGVQELMASAGMADYVANAASFREVSGETLNRRLLSFPAAAN